MTQAIQPKAEIKQEVDVDTAATADSAVEAEDKGEHDTIDSDSDALDAVSKASLKAMEKKTCMQKGASSFKKGCKKRLQSRKKNMRQQLQSKQGHHVQHQLLQLRSSR